MSKEGPNLGDDFDASELLSDQDFDAGALVNAMDRKVGRSKPQKGLDWKRLEELREARLLRHQLQDWGDWDENDS